jgi:hypothetical protein
MALLQHLATNPLLDTFHTATWLPHTGHTMKTGLARNMVMSWLQHRGAKSPWRAARTVTSVPQMRHR